MRLEVLRSANKLPEDTPLKEVEENTLGFFRSNFSSFATYLAFDKSELAGCGSVCFYKLMPTCDCPSGHRAYIMNMYTREEYRRRGVASLLLDKLVEESRSRGVNSISLEATDIGRPLYEKYGFALLEHEMYLPNCQSAKMG